MLDYKGLRDNHLNIYWQYDGKPHLENNITKAFINSIDSLDNSKKRIILNELFGITLINNDFEIEYYLQTKPDPKNVESFPNERRIMFAFSPEGECWGFSGQDTKDEKALFAAIKNELSEHIQDEEKLKQETLEAVKEYMEGQRGGSIPDGWIFIYVNNNPEYVIAMENKLHKLDPNQINNHIEKSLLITSNKPQPIYKKYSDIADVFKKVGSFNTDQFIEYLTILGYLEVNDFSLAVSADEKIRQRLSIPFGKMILTKIHSGEIDERKWNMVRCHVDYAYLREINLGFYDNTIEMALSFGSTQNSGKYMLSQIDGFNIKVDEHVIPTQSFHLMYHRGKNIHDSYINNDNGLDKYIKYLKKHIDYIKTYSPSEAIDLYKTLMKDNFITKDDYERIKTKLTGKTNLVLVIPEFTVWYKWTYSEVFNLGFDGFVTELEKRFNDALKEMELI